MVSCYLWGFNNGLETWFGSHYFKVEIDMLRFGAECKLSFIDGAESLSVKENQRFEQHEIATIIQTAVFSSRPILPLLPSNFSDLQNQWANRVSKVIVHAE